MEERIGVFVCHCGTNIAGTVDVKRVAEELAGYPGVAYSTDYTYMCSDPGQNLVKDAIKEHKLDRRHRRGVFTDAARGDVQTGGGGGGDEPVPGRDLEHPRAVQLGPSGRQGSRDREGDQDHQGHDREGAARRGARADLRSDDTQGAGGGWWYRGDPGGARHRQRGPRGHPRGEVTFHRRPHGAAVGDVPDARLLAVHHDAEDGRGSAAPEGQAHDLLRGRRRSAASSATSRSRSGRRPPTSTATSAPDAGCAARSARPRLRPNSTRGSPRGRSSTRPSRRPYRTSRCSTQSTARTSSRTGSAASARRSVPLNCIDYEQKDEIVEEEVGAIVVATGYDLYPIEKMGEYGGGKYPDVITSLQFERMLSASGPTGGEVLRPSDGEGAVRRSSS